MKRCNHVDVERVWVRLGEEISPLNRPQSNFIAFCSGRVSFILLQYAGDKTSSSSDYCQLFLQCIVCLWILLDSVSEWNLVIDSDLTHTKAVVALSTGRESSLATDFNFTFTVLICLIYVMEYMCVSRAKFNMSWHEREKLMKITATNQQQPRIELNAENCVTTGNFKTFFFVLIPKSLNTSSVRSGFWISLNRAQCDPFNSSAWIFHLFSLFFLISLIRFMLKSLYANEKIAHPSAASP